jgi:hypothetical protein
MPLNRLAPADAAEPSAVSTPNSAPKLEGRGLGKAGGWSRSSIPGAWRTSATPIPRHAATARAYRRSSPSGLDVATLIAPKRAPEAESAAATIELSSPPESSSSISGRLAAQAATQASIVCSISSAALPRECANAAKRQGDQSQLIFTSLFDTARLIPGSNSRTSTIPVRSVLRFW